MEAQYYENIIIGAGPAGLQAAYYFQKYEIDYIVLEKSDKCGSFFETFPHSGKLISINKRHTGSKNKDFNLRHDWNSLLNDKNLNFNKFSDEYYPSSGNMVEYLNSYYENNNLNIEFNSTVVKVEKINENGEQLKLNYRITISNNTTENNTAGEGAGGLACAAGEGAGGLACAAGEGEGGLACAAGEGAELNEIESVERVPLSVRGLACAAKLYECDRLFIAIGMSAHVIPENYSALHASGDIKHYGQYPKKYFIDNLSNYTNKRVLLVGGGNSSYELANMLNNTACSILIMSKTKKKWAMASHYSGDIRSVYLPYIDTFLLKSLNALDELQLQWRPICVEKTENNKYITIVKTHEDKGIMNYPVDENNIFDEVILCTGWKFNKSIFTFPIEMMRSDKYPALGLNYGSINNKNLFFIGAAMHGFDYGKSSGGFIHGFRYLIKSCIHQLFGLSTKNSFKKFDIINKNGFNYLEYTKFINFIIERINTASSLYQMFGVLSDKFYMMANGDLLYLKDVHINNMIDIDNRIKEMEKNRQTKKEGANAEKDKKKDDKEKDDKDKDDKDKDEGKEKDTDEGKDAAEAKDDAKDAAAEAQLKMLKLMEKKTKKILITPDAPVEPANEELPKLNIMLFTLTLEYGSQYNSDIDKLGLATTNMGNESKSNLIHPVLKVFSTVLGKYIDIIHFDEDIFANFNNDIKYRNKLEKIIKSYIL
uniref:FAD/NAD(P)-binding domain-containing protein n=1 Tax=viral metagenome TaxID=1070528 RepID=A0A6C0I287_9ZZZZ